MKISNLGRAEIILRERESKRDDDGVVGWSICEPKYVCRS